MILAIPVLERPFDYHVCICSHPICVMFIDVVTTKPMLWRCLIHCIVLYCIVYGTTTPPDDHRVARHRRKSRRAGRRVGDSRGGETPHHPATVDGEPPGHHPDGRRRGLPADGPRRRQTSGCRATPRHSAGPSDPDMERRLGGGRSLGRRGWRPDQPTIRRGEEDPKSGRLGVQQHPRRAGGDARRARGGAAAGGRPGRDPADPLHRLAGSARHAGDRRCGPEVCAGRRDLAPAHLGLRRKTGLPAVGPGPLWATRQRMGGRAGQGGLQPPTGPSPYGRLQPHQGSRPRRLQGLAGAVAGQPIPADHGRPVSRSRFSPKNGRTPSSCTSCERGTGASQAAISTGSAASRAQTSSSAATSRARRRSAACVERSRTCRSM